MNPLFYPWRKPFACQAIVSIDKNPVIFKEETLMELNVEEIMEILPHRYPMLLVDKIT